MRCADLHTSRGEQAMGQVKESRKLRAVPNDLPTDALTSARTGTCSTARWTRNSEKDACTGT
jgi:hypothetical protein